LDLLFVVIQVHACHSELSGESMHLAGSRSA
jgi:hypothetical protein